MISWHRLFGLGLIDLFTHTGYEVELEKDLSIKKQLLDAIVIERASFAALPDPPDGLEDLGPHNLLTYKSHQEALDDFALDELLGHFVNYRKQISPENGPLMPLRDFRLLAVCTRFPEKLSSQVTLVPQKSGVYEVCWGVRTIKVIVLKEVETVPRNAMWELFSAVPQKVREGARAYHWKKNDLSAVLGKLYNHYQVEGFAMPYTVEDFKRELVEEVVATNPPEEVLRRYKPEERLKTLSREQILEYLRTLDEQTAQSTRRDKQR